MCSAGGWFIKRCSLERNLLITWASTESGRAASFTLYTRGLVYNVQNQRFWATKDCFNSMITIILYFTVHLLQICSSNLYSGAMRPRDHRRRALLSVWVRMQMNRPRAMKWGLNYLDGKYDRVPNDSVGLNDVWYQMEAVMRVMVHSQLPAIVLCFIYVCALANLLSLEWMRN